MDELARAAFGAFRVQVCGIGSDHHVFFPSTATFPIPLATRRPVMGLPIDTSWVLVFIPRDTDHAEVDSIMRDPAIVMAMSIGTNRARRVVIPPGIGAEDDGSGFPVLRAIYRQLLNGYSVASKAHGIKPWTIDD